MKVGVTGHQHLDDPTAWGWVREAVRRELDTITSPLVVISCLAAGADQLVAGLGAERGSKLTAILPFADVERTLEGDDLKTYHRLLDKASVEVLEAVGTEEDSYLAAGKRVVEVSDVVLAVWDGKPAKGKGGTADIVGHALTLGRPVIHINPTERKVGRL